MQGFEEQRIPTAGAREFEHRKGGNTFGRVNHENCAYIRNGNLKIFAIITDVKTTLLTWMAGFHNFSQLLKMGVAWYGTVPPAWKIEQLMGPAYDQ